MTRAPESCQDSLASRFNRHFETARPYHWRILNRFRIPQEDRDDVYQKSCFSFWAWCARREAAEPDLDPSAHGHYHFRITINCSKDYWRARNRNKEGQVPLRPDGEEVGEAFFGPSREPHPLAIVMEQEAGAERTRLLRAAVRGQGKKLIGALIKACQPASAAETIDFVEAFLFDKAEPGDGAEGPLAERIASQLGVTSNWISVNKHRAAAVWNGLRRKLLG